MEGRKRGRKDDHDLEDRGKRTSPGCVRFRAGQSGRRVGLFGYVMLCVETLIGRRASATLLRLVSCAFVHTMGFLSNAPVGTASSGCCGRLTQCLRLVSHFSQGCIGVFWTLRQPTRAPGQQTSLVINDCRRRLSDLSGRKRKAMLRELFVGFCVHL